MKLTVTIEPSAVGNILTLADLQLGLGFLRLESYSEDVYLYANVYSDLEKVGGVSSLTLEVNV